MSKKSESVLPEFNKPGVRIGFAITEGRLITSLTDSIFSANYFQSLFKDDRSLKEADESTKAQNRPLFTYVPTRTGEIPAFILGVKTKQTNETDNVFIKYDLGHRISFNPTIVGASLISADSTFETIEESQTPICLNGITLCGYKMGTSGVFSVVLAKLLDETPKPLSTGPAISEIINTKEITQQVFYRGDGSPWLQQYYTDGANGSVSLELLTAYKSNSVSNGSIAIRQGDGTSFGLFTSMGTGYIGWQQSANSNLTLRASSITTTGSLISNGLFTAESGIATTSSFVPTSLRYLVGNITVEGKDERPNSMATILFKQPNGSNLIGTVSENSTSALFLSGSFLIEGNNPNGMLLSVNGTNNSSIRFAVNNTEAARFSTTGSLLIGTIVEEPSLILDVQSTTKGVRFPVMKTFQRRAIKNPATSEIVFDSDLGKYCFYDGEGWQAFYSQKIN